MSRRSQQLALALINTGAGLSGICSSVGLGAGPYGDGRQCYSLVRISRRTQQLALALINTGAGLLSICSSVGLGAEPLHSMWRLEFMLYFNKLLLNKHEIKLPHTMYGLSTSAGLLRPSRDTYQALALAPDSVLCSAQPDTTADTGELAPVFVEASATCLDRLEIRTSPSTGAQPVTTVEVRIRVAYSKLFKIFQKQLCLSV